MSIKTNYLESQSPIAPSHGIALATDIDFAVAQSVVFPNRSHDRFLLSRIALVSKLIDTLSAGATVVVEERDRVKTRAALTTAMTGANNDVTLTAAAGEAGVAGNSITLALVNPGTPSAALSVAVATKAITVSLATTAGTKQVETATAAGTITEPGDIEVVITGAGVTGSPITLAVAVADNDTATLWAAKVRAALAANAAITSLYAVSGATTGIILTRLAATANDSTLNIALATGTATGVTTAATSANTTAGVAPAISTTATALVAAINASAAAAALVSAIVKSGDTGAVAVTALAASNLSAGADYTVVQAAVVASGDLVDSDAVGLSQVLTLATGVKPIQGGNDLALVISVGSTATVDTKDVVIEGTHIG